ncbi:MAG: helix-turn-helix domain-containing protein [Polyangiales bacterium]
MGKRVEIKGALDRERWAEAALQALIGGGLRAVSVERIAEQLSVTKGSFYWHFASRAELLAAMAARWEAVATEAIIAEVEAIVDPRERLRALLRASFDDVANLRAEAALAAAAQSDRAVARVVLRVMKRRLAYTESVYRALGQTPAGSRRLAIAAYGAYLGTVQLAGVGLLGEENRSLADQARLLGELLMPAER